MAPTRSSTRRAAHPPSQPPPPPVPEQQPEDANINAELFLDPMLGQPLNLYIEKDVEDKEELTQLIIILAFFLVLNLLLAVMHRQKHGGTVSPGYSGLNYILVDPYKPSGQNLYRQYANKKGKVILSARWVHECIKSNQLHTFRTNWAGCKVTGNEQGQPPPAESSSRAMQPVAQMPPPPIQAPIPQVAPMHPYQFVYTNGMPTTRGVPGAPPPQTWVTTMAPPQAHLQPPPPHPPGPATDLVHRPPPGSSGYRDEAWGSYTPPEEIAGQPAPYDYRYRTDQNWVPPPGPYYDTTNYDHTYHQPPYMAEQVDQSSTAASGAAGAMPAESSTAAAEREERPRGRKRTRTQPPPAAPATTLVVNRNPPARSPTPPTRVIKSTYGGNLFTADDVIYLKRYIDYCQEQCLVLSLREICERIAVKAPHHTYCNKHQIRLSGYTMNHDRSESPGMDDDVNMEAEEAGPQASTSSAPREQPAPHLRLDLAAATAAASAAPARNRSPTPPRALFRSTTGKGVAFTQEDVTFLIRFMEYRKSQGALDMIAFWKEVAIKAPHHSRASWMKFWRRHKHELERQEGDEPLPLPPDKKMRYSKSDDILLAKFFYSKPEGTSDKIFQHFGRMHPHHPWKGWQEHHRIHKARIEHLISQLAAGQNIDILEGENS
ncbi:hypothetical protein CVT24_004244 [Panaeolus cyanescens]|uniref:BRCT domain-containing protein n=1 Tax=Panaeolus cyanescens TaxID=181874 RepID=A0A409VDC7_9AGAR|nr:hypothetical protein CVT24_004244 [Panaeolus cyanescens]